MDSEAKLITAAKRQDIDAFNQLVLTYQDMAYRVAYRLMQDEAAAMDATQNAMISAYRHLDQFWGDNFKAWLMRIVKNACYDELRRRQRRPSVSLDDMETESDGLRFDESAGLNTPQENPEHAAQRSALQSAIEGCIGALGDGYRDVVIFADIEGYSYEETAEILGISIGTVKSRLSRARAKLRDCLRGFEELLPDQYRL